MAAAALTVCVALGETAGRNDFSYRVLSSAAAAAGCPMPPPRLPPQAFLRSGEAGPDGAPGEPSLERFEAEIQRYKAVQDEIQAKIFIEIKKNSTSHSDLKPPHHSLDL